MVIVKVTTMAMQVLKLNCVRELKSSKSRYIFNDTLTIGNPRFKGISNEYYSVRVCVCVCLCGFGCHGIRHGFRHSATVAADCSALVSALQFDDVVSIS